MNWRDINRKPKPEAKPGLILYGADFINFVNDKRNIVHSWDQIGTAGWRVTFTPRQETEQEP